MRMSEPPGALSLRFSMMSPISWMWKTGYPGRVQGCHENHPSPSSDIVLARLSPSVLHLIADLLTFVFLTFCLFAFRFATPLMVCRYISVRRWRPSALLESVIRRSSRFWNGGW